MVFGASGYAPPLMLGTAFGTPSNLAGVGRTTTKRQIQTSVSDSVQSILWASSRYFATLDNPVRI